MDMKQNKKITNTDSKNKTSTELDGKPSPVKKRKHPVFFMSVLISTSLIIGGAGGFLLYSNLHSEQATLGTVGSEGHVPTQDEIQKQMAQKADFTKSYKGKAYELVNYALAKQASYSYALTIGEGSVVSSGVEQTIKSCTYTTPEVIYNQNVSSSWIVHTANRFYDYYNGVVSCYLRGTPEEWKNVESPKDYTYNQYIQKYGKLLQGSYYCVTETENLSEEHPLSDIYLTNKKEEYDSSNEESKHHVNGVIIYMIGPKSVKNSTISKTNDGFLITLDLVTDADMKNEFFKGKGFIPGSQYYGVQMRETGGLSSRPPFSKIHLEFNLTEEFTLVSSVFLDAYTAKVGPINSGADAKLTQYYFHSDSSTFNGVTIEVPKPNDSDNFSGYKLFPEKK